MIEFEKCTTCDSGHFAADDETCQLCPWNSYGEGSVCFECPENFVSAADRLSCVPEQEAVQEIMIDLEMPSDNSAMVTFRQACEFALAAYLNITPNRVVIDAVMPGSLIILFRIGAGSTGVPTVTDTLNMVQQMTPADITMITTAIATATAAIDCIGDWGDWSDCSASCGGGTKERSYSVATAAANGGQPCPGDSPQSMACNEQGCLIDCVGDWGDWSDCSASCGDGTSEQWYIITTAAANGGQPCPGDSPQSMACNDRECAATSTTGDTGTSAVGSITATLALNSDVVELAGVAGSAKRASFVANFKRDIAAILGVTEEQITVNSIGFGSPVVDFSVTSSESGAPITTSDVEQAFGGIMELPAVGVFTTGPVMGVSAAQPETTPTSPVNPSPSPATDPSPSPEQPEEQSWGWTALWVVLGLVAVIVIVVLALCIWHRARLKVEKGQPGTELDVTGGGYQSREPIKTPQARGGFADTLSRTSSGVPVTPQLQGEVSQIFARFDYDRTGKLDQDQIMTFVKSQQWPGVTPDYVYGVWSVFDINRDGALDAAEFASMLKVLKDRTVQFEWEEHWSEEHARPYWVNARTAQSSWTAPIEAVRQTSPRATPSLASPVQTGGGGSGKGKKGQRGTRGGGGGRGKGRGKGDGRGGRGGDSQRSFDRSSTLRASSFEQHFQAASNIPLA
jgi:uncharacterized membrane protein YgcG